MFNHKLLSIFLVLITFSMFLPNNVFAEECLKMVFDKYCLGGSATEIEKKYSPDLKNVNGNTTSFIYKDGDSIEIVRAYKGKVMVVIKTYKPGTRLNYISMQSKLNNIYGPGEDASYFPDYAESNDSRDTAISLGKGKQQENWQQEGWKVSLIWANREKIHLFYVHDKLHAESKNDNPEGL